MSSLQKYFVNDYEYIQKAIWFIEKNQGLTVTDEYDSEWNEVKELYDNEPTIELFMRMHYHYPSELIMLRILHPDDFDDIIVDKIYNDVIDNFVVGCINTTIINDLVNILTNIVNYNSQSKELYVLCKNIYTKNQLTLKWIKVSDSFEMYLLSIFEKIIGKIIEYISDFDSKEVTKIKTELSKLTSAKYVKLFYNKNVYKRQSIYTHNFTDFNQNNVIFKNGYLNLDTDEFVCSIANIFDENNQCMNIEWKEYCESNLSTDYNVKYIISMLNKMFYNKVSKSISIVYGSSSIAFMNLIEQLFGSYIVHVSVKEYISKYSEIKSKFVIIDAPSDISLSLVYNKLNENQYALLNCSNNHFPKFVGTVDTNKINIFTIDHDIFNRYSIETFFADIIFSDEFVNEPFTANIVKQSLLNEINSADYFCKACMVFGEEEESYSEVDLYKYYITFCKNNNLIRNTITGFINVLSLRPVNIEGGEIGSRIFSGFKIVLSKTQSEKIKKD